MDWERVKESKSWRTQFAHSAHGESGWTSKWKEGRCGLSGLCLSEGFGEWSN